MAEGESGAFCTQLLYLLKLILRLKSWKFLLWVLLGPSLFFNFFLFRDIEKVDEGEVKLDGLTELTMESAMSHGVLVPEKSREKKDLIDILRLRKANSKDWFHNCNDFDDCRKKFVQSIAARSSDISSIMMYGSNKTIRLYCLKDGKSQILCPFVYHAVSQSLESFEYNKAKSAKATTALFKEITFAKFFDKFGKGADDDFGMNINISKPDSMCTRTTKSGSFSFKFLLYFMTHMLLVTAAFILYTTVGTLSSMTNMKENGFLQLVFNNGLSVSAYWLAYWIITLVEVFVSASLLIASYEIQCPGYFESEGMANTFIAVSAMFICLAATGFFFATLLQSFFIVLLLMILVQIICVVQIVVIKLKVVEGDPDSATTLMLMLMYPPGCIADYGIKQLLPKLVQLKTKKEFDDFFSSILPMMICVPIVIIVITIYLDFIVKNGNGLCLPYLYPLNPSFWNPHRHKLIEMVDDQPKRANIEPTVGIPAVIADDIHLTYPSALCESKKPPVLKGITCTVYQGQITALIGHNGAGKTTLIRVLMGEEIPSSGVAIINGHRVTDPYQRLALRGSVSICKQVDVLSNYLTVMESMKLTLVAKGFSPDSQVPKVLDMMKRLGLAGKENVQAMDLSGGQMRKVCSIICLLGNPKLVILDEPTSGLDPVSRRNLWQILQDHKAGRSIILCTQFMDEADILADRKIFLSAGKIICAGSSMFLKHAFGCCVSINVSLKSESYALNVVKLLRKVKLVGHYQTEMQLQVSAGKPQVLADAILALEENADLVDAFGVSQAQLDDIFMRLKFIDLDNIEASFKSKKLRKLGRTGGSNAGTDRVDFSSLYNFESSKPLNATFCTQFSALMRSNMSRQWKAKMKFCFRIIFPLVMVIGIVVLGNMENDEAAKAKSKKASPKDEPSDESTESIAIINMNSTAMLNSLFVHRGLCIADKESGIRKEDLEMQCQSIFSSPIFTSTRVALKDRKSSVSSFVQTDAIKKELRRLCPKSNKMQTHSCFFVYASDWSAASKNSERTVYHGIYENPPSEDIPEGKQRGIYAALRYYNLMANYFGAIEQSTMRNFTLASMYLTETLDSFQFQKCYELFTLMAGFALVPVTYLNDPIEDKDSGVRMHLASMGMSNAAYWFTTFLMHWFHYSICFFLMALACLIVPKYQAVYFFAYIVLPLTILGTACNQLSVYVVSAMMKRTNAIVLVLYFFFAMFIGMLCAFLQTNEMALYILMAVLPPFPPQVVLLMGMKILLFTMQLFQIKNPEDVPSLGEAFIANKYVQTAFMIMPIHILVQICAIAIIENPTFLSSICAKSMEISQKNVKPIKDEGVEIEANRIRKTTRNSVNMLEVRDLQKVYPNGVHAVRGTTFGSFSGEILGLLGPNGAGKTTSMSIIVGEEESSSGTSEVHFSGTWMSGMEGARCGAIGYCPQHNPLFNSISVYEHLCFYAQIRGIPAELAKAQIAGLIDGLGLKPHQAKAAEQLSGGNKRRLCLAISLLGNPSLIVIDEASTGVDPENKRFIWSAIRGMANKQRSVMITTHSMEEVEALCARVGIMNKGLMIGFGTVQQLRSRHGEAFTLDILMKSKKPQKLIIKKAKLTKRMTKQFPNAIVMEDLQRSMQFSLPKKSVPTFSAAMRWLIAKKKKLGMHYFSLYQMSLDQVFVKLVKEYDES